jgi:hypothetical protein
VQSTGQENWRKIDEIFISNFPSAFKFFCGEKEKKKQSVLCFLFTKKKIEGVFGMKNVS